MPGIDHDIKYMRNGCDHTAATRALQQRCEKGWLMKNDQSGKSRTLKWKVQTLASAF